MVKRNGVQLDHDDDCYWVRPGKNRNKKLFKRKGQFIGEKELARRDEQHLASKGKRNSERSLVVVGEWKVPDCIKIAGLFSAYCKTYHRNWDGEP